MLEDKYSPKPSRAKPRSELGELMIFDHQRLAAQADQIAKLVAEWDELERLRERVKNAELSLCTSRRKSAWSSGTNRRQCATSTAHPLRLPVHR
jgi:hypothetical protein